jgi:hypothetical protein
MHNIVNGAVDGLLSQSGADLSADSADVDTEPEAVVSPSRPAVHNTVTGNVAGTVIQAGDVYGGLTIS